MSGRIVILNGAPRAGKSTLAAAMQTDLGGHWINLGVDVINRSLPPDLVPGIGLRPGGERPELEPLLPALYVALYDSIAAHARQGFNVVADLGHHDHYSQTLNLLPQCLVRLAGLDVLLVGVSCDLDTIMARRNANPDGYVAGEGVPAPVQRWQDSVHVPGIYDLVVDGAAPPADAVAAIAAALANPPTPSAASQLTGR
ncbi:hypothetical protein WH87_18120 [Devosia epidermidihirudinis]|uniref:Chloramphenicol phosphotransferase n=1 Tax=Devosia epidermidihirudinis TaxID=1293439 RepID=A0A0F5Q2I5_9HYPH|nr:hypothetical protein [Devosia epidermidihirudinis]KKC35070.1 hypothetical protein WH87_18120 [Devosia epidermidihirudinis]